MPTLLFRKTESGIKNKYFHIEDIKSAKERGWMEKHPSKVTEEKPVVVEVSTAIPPLEELRQQAKDIGYSYYKNAKEKKLIEVIKAHYDNQD